MIALADSLWQEAMRAHGSGDRSAANVLATRLLDLEPQGSRARWLLATLALEQGDIAAALMHLDVARDGAAGMAPHQAIAITRLMITAGRFEPAFEMLEAIRGSAPQASVLIAIGEQLLMLERYREAILALSSAKAAGISHPMLSFLLSSAYRFVGDFPAAIDEAEATLRQQPDFAHAHWALAQLGPSDLAHKRIDRIRQSIASLESRGDRASTVIQSGLSMLWHALFREFDSLDERGAAWLALSRGLALKRQLQPHDRAAEDRLFSALLETYSARFMEASEHFGSGEASPIFILGMPRTGTTLVERLVTRHDLVAGGGELNELHLLVKQRTNHWCAEFINETIAGRLGRVDLDGLGADYLESTAWRREGKPFLVDKHQSNFLLAGVIARCMPYARMIHVSRDPLDACFSNLKEPFALHAYSYSNDQLDVAHHYRSHQRLMAHIGAIAGTRVLEVRYEDLVRDRGTQSARIFDFLGLHPPPSPGDNASNPKPVASASSVQARQPIHERNIGAWRRYADELATLTQFFG